MKLFNAIGFVLIAVQLVASVPADRERRQADECAPYVAAPGQCDVYLAGQRPPLLLISFDGFRADYLNRTTGDVDAQSLSPTLNLLGRCGVRARSMVPVYPSLTFPNHYSMVTGLYPDAHGIVSNSFYDPDLKLSFSLSSPNATQPWWWIGEPIWYTAKKQGKKSATYFWPGSDVKDEVREPTYWLPYNGSIPYPERIVQILEWLNLPVEERPNYLTLYLDEPDHAGHGNGPDSPIVNDEIMNVDSQLQSLLKGMEDSGILGCVDIMVVSDHGMASTPQGKYFVLLKDFISDVATTTRTYDGVFPNIRPNTDTQEEQDRIGQSLQCQNPHLRVYNKWDLPRRHHYFQSNRIPSIILDMTVRWRAYTSSEYILSGNHGWDNLNDEMQATFVAQGPSFQRGITVAPFRNIELYNLMCSMIGVDPSPNHGTWGALNHFLSNPPSNPTVTPLDPPDVLGYPEDQDTYNQHLTRQTCDLLVTLNDPSTDGSLNLTESETNESIDLHGPWGLPRSADADIDASVVVLVNRGRVTGFDVESGYPSWTSYTLNNVRQTTNLPQWRLDVRLESDHQSICDRYVNKTFTDAILVPLFPLGFTSELMEWDAQIDTNAMEASTGFQTYWTHFHELIAQTVSNHGPVNVIVGPHKEDRRPSLFAIISSCQSAVNRLSDCSLEDLDIQSFILPTFPRYNGDCTDPTAFLAVNVATVKDVEILTGLDFFPMLSYEGKASILVRTALASHLIVNPDPNPIPEPETTSTASEPTTEAPTTEIVTEATITTEPTTEATTTTEPTTEATTTTEPTSTMPTSTMRSTSTESSTTSSAMSSIPRISVIASSLMTWYFLLTV